MPVLNAKGLQGLAIYCTSLERAKPFYIDILGCEVGDEVPCGLFLKSGDVTIYLEEGRTPAHRDFLKHPGIAPCFAVDGLKAAFENLKSSGVKIVSAYEEYSPTFAMCRIADPDGNVLELAGEP